MTEEKELSAEEKAAQDFEGLEAKFKKAIFKGDFSRKGLARVFYHAVTYPLVEKPKFKSNIEELVFAWALHLVSSKYVMMHKVMEEKVLKETKDDIQK